MPTFNVHIFREMRLAFGGIEADSHEDAAAIARDKPTEQADSIDDECDGENLAALVDVAGDEEHAQSRMIDFEPERQRKAAAKLLDALRWITRCPKIKGPVGTTAYIVSDETMAQAHAAVAEAEAATIAFKPHAKKPYSVLLLYPDDVNDDGTKTYYTFVEAAYPEAAVAEALRQALATNEWTEEDVDPAGFVPLLVIEGHHFGQPTSND
jgi:hypothetical protein